MNTLETLPRCLEPLSENKFFALFRTDGFVCFGVPGFIGFTGDVCLPPFEGSTLFFPPPLVPGAAPIARPAILFILLTTNLPRPLNTFLIDFPRLLISFPVSFAGPLNKETPSFATLFIRPPAVTDKDIIPSLITSQILVMPFEISSNVLKILLLFFRRKTKKLPSNMLVKKLIIRSKKLIPGTDGIENFLPPVGFFSNSSSLSPFFFISSFFFSYSISF